MEAPRLVRPGMTLADVQRKNNELWTGDTAQDAKNDPKVVVHITGGGGRWVLTWAGGSRTAKSAEEAERLASEKATQLGGFYQYDSAKDATPPSVGQTRRVDWDGNSTVKVTAVNGGKVSMVRVRGGKPSTDPEDFLIVSVREFDNMAWDSAKDATQVSKTAAQYSASGGNSKDKCGKCRFFRTPGSCVKVEGAISPAGLCKYYETKSGDSAKDGPVYQQIKYKGCRIINDGRSDPNKFTIMRGTTLVGETNSMAEAKALIDKLPGATGDETTVMVMRREMYDKVEVGKVYKFDGRRGLIKAKHEDTRPLVTIEWLE